MSRDWMTSKDLVKSPLVRARVAAITWSLTFSGGPVKVCLSLISRRRLNVLLMSRRLESWVLAAMFGTSRSMAQMRCTASRSSRLMCMWYGIWRRLSNLSC
ncbi:unnamed protein product [Linum trigynum]|uniref:Uncharacterized protein n=1 Tax=Linum trigynum TaxID=586398 RepID=A0AAV2GWE5_9ROSI